MEKEKRGGGRGREELGEGRKKGRLLVGIFGNVDAAGRSGRFGATR